MTLVELFDMDPSPMCREERELMEATKDLWAQRRKEFIKELKRSQKGPRIMTRIVVKKDR